MNLKKDFEEMTPYERLKLKVDFLRFLATLGAPFIMVTFGYIAKNYLGW